MSRRCEAIVVGTVLVQLVCDMCEKTQWMPVKMHRCNDDPEWEAVHQDSNKWSWQDDSIVCSGECAERFYSDPYDDSCSDCYHDKTQHGQSGCQDTISGCGPSDNTDVWEMPCGCDRSYGE